MSNDSENRLCLAIMMSAYYDFHKALNKLYKKYNKHYEINGNRYGRPSLIREIKEVFDFVNSEWFLYLNNNKDIRKDITNRMINEMYEQYWEERQDEKNFTKKCNC